MRLVARALLFSALLLPAALAHATAPSKVPAPEYTNLSLSTPELSRALHHATLVARAHITAYRPPAVHNHVGTVEQVTLQLDEVYTGKNTPGSPLTYVCVCHMAEPPVAADMVGHEVLAILTYDPKAGTWSPTLQPSPLFFNAALRDRVLRLLRKAP